MGQQTVVCGLTTCCSNKVLLNQNYTHSLVLSAVAFHNYRIVLPTSLKYLLFVTLRKSLLTPDLIVYVKQNELLTHNHLCLSFFICISVMLL